MGKFYKLSIIENTIMKILTIAVPCILFFLASAAIASEPADDNCHHFKEGIEYYISGHQLFKPENTFTGELNFDETRDNAYALVKSGSIKFIPSEFNESKSLNNLIILN